MNAGLQDQWLIASTELTRRMLSNGEERPLDMVLRYAMRGIAADFATLALRVTPKHLIVRAAAGARAEPLLGTIVGRDLPEQLGSTIAAPLPAGDESGGLLSVGRLPGRASFAEPDRDHLAGFASHAGVALELDRLRSLPSAHADLHDHLVQELFTVCLGLQGLAPIQARAENRERVAGFVDRLDALIRRVRAADSSTLGQESLPHRLLAIVDDLPVPVHIQFDGRLNLPEGIADQVVAVVRGELCDVGRSAHASQVRLCVRVVDDVVTVEIVDDGGTRLTWTASSLVSDARRFA